MKPIVKYLVLGAALTGCADDPVAYSEPISLRLGGIKDEDVRDGEASRDKSVKDEDGEPYKDFLAASRAELDGMDPSAIRVTRVDVRLGADTDGVNDLGEVFESFEVFLSDDRTTIPIGTVDSPSGTSVEVDIEADEEDLAALQDALLANDKLHVGVRGPMVESPPADFDLKLSIDIVFEALP